ncbi:ATP11 protein-domain-containing protein [Biscogniauxia marginata]|nr:ATP11 protein-domain-containing protein [Biscogniauxia marginata]
MATARFSALRDLLGCSSRHANLRGLLAPATRSQRRWAQVHDVRFLATTQAVSHSVTEKYREKLDRKAREEGHRDIGELKAAYADRIREIRKGDGISVPGLDALLADAEPAPRQLPHTAPPAPDGLSQRPPPPPFPISSSSSSASAVRNTTRSLGKPAVKPLSAILDLPKARALPARELAAVWRLRHAADPSSLCAAIPASTTYAALEAAARRHPAFVLPVPRGAGVGAEMHFLQWVFDGETDTATVLFTQLAEYKARGEWAQPHTSVTHYWDRRSRGRENGGVVGGDGDGGGNGEMKKTVVGLSEPENQDLVLMAGNVVEGRGASVQDARWLVMLLQRFYGEGDGEKRRLLEQFTRGDSSFSVERLLEESEKLG